MKKGSFSIVNEKGLFRNLKSNSIISVYGLNFLEDYLKNNKFAFTKKEIEALDLFINKIKTLPITKAKSSTLENDCDDKRRDVCTNKDQGNEFAKNVRQGMSIKDAIESVSGEFLYHDSMKKAYVCAKLSSPSTTFDPQEHDIFNNDISSWHLDFENLVPHFTTIARICKDLNITNPVNKMKNALKFKQALENNKISIREKSVENDLVSTTAWAIYYVSKNEYANPQWYGASLASAKLFESKSAALKAIGKRSYSQCIPVEIELKMKSIDLSNLPSNTKANLSTLQEALSIIQRQDIEDALNQADIERIRERLKVLEEKLGDSPDNFSQKTRKKKM